MFGRGCDLLAGTEESRQKREHRVPEARALFVVYIGGGAQVWQADMLTGKILAMTKRDWDAERADELRFFCGLISGNSSNRRSADADINANGTHGFH